MKMKQQERENVHVYHEYDIFSIGIPMQLHFLNLVILHIFHTRYNYCTVMMCFLQY